MLENSLNAVTWQDPEVDRGSRVLGSMLSLLPAWKTVAAVVVRTMAFVAGLDSRPRITIRRVSQRFANTARCASG